MSLVPRSIPVHYDYDTDFWPSSRSSDFWPSHRSYYRGNSYWPMAMPVRRHFSEFDPYPLELHDRSRWRLEDPYMSWPRPWSSQELRSPPPMPVVPAQPAFPAMPEQFNKEASRMDAEMNKMMESFQKMAPGTAEDYRLTENFRMDNPVITDVDGRRRFKLQFDVRQFRPDEINVKTSGHHLSVQAKHEDKESGKSAYREYSRQYLLPKEVNPELLSSKLSADGVLIIEAPLPSIEGPREKLIPIEHGK